MSQTDTRRAWAIWLDDGTEDVCVAVTAPDEAAAIEAAQAEAGIEDDDPHVDGPMQGEPGYFEFTFRTEHRERVVVEGPNEEYAEELARHDRDFRGEYVQTIHTDSRRIPKDGDAE